MPRWPKDYKPKPDNRLLRHKDALRCCRERDKEWEEIKREFYNQFTDQLKDDLMLYTITGIAWRSGTFPGVISGPDVKYLRANPETGITYALRPGAGQVQLTTQQRKAYPPDLDIHGVEFSEDEVLDVAIRRKTKKWPVWELIKNTTKELGRIGKLILSKVSFIDLVIDPLIALEQYNQNLELLERQFEFDVEACMKEAWLPQGNKQIAISPQVWAWNKPGLANIYREGFPNRPNWTKILHKPVRRRVRSPHLAGYKDVFGPDTFKDWLTHNYYRRAYICVIKPKKLA